MYLNSEIEIQILYNSKSSRGNNKWLTFINNFLRWKHGKHFCIYYLFQREWGGKKKIKLINNVKLEKKSLLHNVHYHSQKLFKYMQVLRSISWRPATLWASSAHGYLISPPQPSSKAHDPPGPKAQPTDNLQKEFSQMCQNFSSKHMLPVAKKNRGLKM